MADPLLEQLERNATWDATFQGTSLARRRRARESAMEYEEEKLAQEEDALQRRAAYDRTAQDFLFKREALRQKADSQKDLMDLRERQFTAQQEVRRMQVEAQKAALAASTALERSRINKELRDAKNAERLAIDTDAFESGAQSLLDNGIHPGSREYADGILRLAVKHPFVEPKYRAQIFSEGKIKATADDVMSDFNKFKSQGMDVTAIGDADGGFRLVARPVKTTPRDEDLKRLQHVEGLFARTKDEDLKTYLKNDALTLRKRLGMEDEAPAAAPAPTPTPPSPAADDPRRALASRALEDPNASEAHKAAARRILGLQ